MNALDPKFAKILALLRSTQHPGEEGVGIPAIRPPGRTDVLDELRFRGPRMTRSEIIAFDAGVAMVTALATQAAQARALPRDDRADEVSVRHGGPTGGC